MKLPFLNRISLQDKAFLARQLATMLSSGIALEESLKILQEESSNTAVKDIFREVIEDIEAGSSFSGAIEKHPDLFSRVYIAMTKSGEASGKLEEVLLQLADSIENENSIISRIRSAMVYPIFIILAMIGVGALMMVRVIPQLKSIFLESGVSLPFSTRVLISLSDFLINQWYIALLIIILIVVAVRYYLRSHNGQVLVNQVQARFPGKIGQDLYMARFSRTMSMLTKAGVPIIQSLDITAGVMNNIIYQESLSQAAGQVERGLPLSTPLAQNRFFPRIVSQMILVGEQTGRLDTILEKLSSYYDQELDRIVRGLSSLIEPVIIVILGIGVAFLVIAVLMPIYSIAQLQ